MKKLITAATALLILLAGCAKNEMAQGTDNENYEGKVRFSALANRTTRAAEDNPIINTGGLQNVGEFKVCGYVGSDELVNATVEWDGTSWEYENEPYWPDAKMNFYAYANWATNPSITNAGIAANNVIIAQDKLDGTGQKDFLVAAEIDAEKKVRTTLTFKHALTQIVFRTGNLDPTNLQVRIGGVRIVNIADGGNMAVGNDKAVKWTPNSNKAKYYLQGLQTENQTAFEAADIAAATPFNVETVTSTTAYSAYKQLQLAGTTGNNALLLTPQAFDSWNPNDADKPAVTTKAYLEILAIINHPGKVSTDISAGSASYYYCGTPATGADGKNDKYGKIYIPVESVAAAQSQWTPGKRITYIITFGDKGSGSGGGGYDEDNEPILVPIRFNAVVENWVDVEIPLLTASFETTSDNITAALIDGFTNQLMTDISAAKEIKIYKANIKINGILPATADLTISFDNSAKDKIATGSTVTYNFTGITNWNGKKITMPVPAGWSAKHYKGDTEGTEATTSITVEGSTADKFVLTRITDVP